MECVYVVAFVDDQHRQRSDHIETGNHQDECEEDVGDELLYLHNLEGAFLLFVTVEHLIVVAQLLLDGLLHSPEVRTLLEAQFHSREVTLTLEKPACKVYARDDIVGILFSLLHHETDVG